MIKVFKIILMLIGTLGIYILEIYLAHIKGYSSFLFWSFLALHFLWFDVFFTWIRFGKLI
jgi:hypothetical protein